MTGVKLDLTSDIHMSQFIENVRRGGVSNLAQRYCKTNNEYLKSNIKSQ